jgi:hypothetical protein
MRCVVLVSVLAILVSMVPSATWAFIQEYEYCRWVEDCKK